MASTPSVGYSYEDGSSGTIRRTGAVYPNGRTIGYQYASGADDAFNRVSAILDGDSASAPVLAQYARLGLKRFVQADYPQPSLRYDLAFGAGVDPYAGLDQFNRVGDLRWWNPSTGQDVERIQHGYDQASNRLWRQNPVAAAMGVSADELYSYDGMNQLASFARGQLTSDQTALATGTETFAQAWSLDPTGNWSEFQQDSTGSGTWDLDQPRSHNAVNEITAFGDNVGPQGSSPAYDLAGNMTALPKPASPTDSLGCTYDAWNRLVQVADAATGVTLARYQYDARNFRTIKFAYAAGQVLETRYSYCSRRWQPVEERATSSLTADPASLPSASQFVWGLRYVDDLVLRDRDTTGDGALDERLYALQDGRSNVTAVADPGGSVAERYSYGTYGSPTYRTVAFAATGRSLYDWERLFAGRWLDGESGLYYYRARYHDPVLGRFISRDRIGYLAGDASLYRYVWNSPTNRTDPWGLVPNGQPTSGRAQDSDGDDDFYWDFDDPRPGSGVNSGNVDDFGPGADFQGDSDPGIPDRSGLPLNGPPNSSDHIEGPNGQIRDYGPDGRAKTDFDFGHPQHHPDLESPHAHDWDCPSGKPQRGPGRNVGPNEVPPAVQRAAAGAAAGITVWVVLDIVAEFWWVPVVAL
jgi:RHS repeat-associated protein